MKLWQSRYSRSVSKLLKQPCHRSDIFIKLFTSYQQFVGSLWGKECEDTLLIACWQTCEIFSCAVYVCDNDNDWEGYLMAVAISFLGCYCHSLSRPLPTTQDISSSSSSHIKTATAEIQNHCCWTGTLIYDHDSTWFKSNRVFMLRNIVYYNESSWYLRPNIAKLVSSIILTAFQSKVIWFDDFIPNFVRLTSFPRHIVVMYFRWLSFASRMASRPSTEQCCSTLDTRKRFCWIISNALFSTMLIYYRRMIEITTAVLWDRDICQWLLIHCNTGSSAVMCSLLCFSWVSEHSQRYF